MPSKLTRDGIPAYLLFSKTCVAFNKNCYCDVTMMLLRCQSISTTLSVLKGYQDGNHKEPSEQRL